MLKNWSFVVLNSLVKVNKNEVIDLTFERLKISLKSSMGPVWAWDKGQGNHFG
jgi:hypothetical protein